MGYCVLLVDDEPHALSAMIRLLRQKNFQLLTAHSAQEAKTLMKTHPVDLVISDEMMPGIPGLEFLNWAASNYPAVERILLTGKANLDMAIRGMDMDCSFRFVSKGGSNDDLLQTIDESLKNLVY